MQYKVFRLIENNQSDGLVQYKVLRLIENNQSDGLTWFMYKVYLLVEKYLSDNLTGEEIRADNVYIYILHV